MSHLPVPEPPSDSLERVADRGVLERWLSSREPLISFGLASITAVLGFLIGRDAGSSGPGPFFFPTLVLAFLEVALGTTIWAVREMGAQAAAMQQHLSTELRDTAARTDFVQAQMHEDVARFRTELATSHGILGHLGQLQDAAALADLESISADLAAARDHPLRYHLMRVDLEQTARALSERRTQYAFSIWARRKSIAVHELFHNYMDALPRDWSYDTVTNLAFWSSQTIYRPYDFIDANVRAATQRAVSIRRVFILEPSRILSADEVALLQRHQEVSDQHELIQTVVARPELGETPHQIGNFAICSSASSELAPTLLEMHYEDPAADGRIEFQRMEVVTDSSRIVRHRDRFARYFDRAEGIDQVLLGHSSNQLSLFGTSDSSVEDDEARAS